MNRKGQWEREWLEYLAGALLVLGIFIAARGAYVGAAYLVSFLIGALLGKFWYDIIRRKQTRVHIAVLTLAVLLGMMLGGLTVDTRWLVLLYALGLALSYSAHKEKWI
jgi:hypothetical protein